DLVSNATNYQFEFTDNATGAVFTKQRTANFFQFGLYTECGYGKTYSIKARAYVAGVWGTYGSACDVTTPTFIPSTQIQSGQCGMTSGAMNTTIYCDAVSNTSIYEFEFTDNATGNIFTKQRTVNFFQFGLYTECGYGKTFSIRVRPYVAGNWGSFGSSCSISTPVSIPTTKIQNSQCGITVAAMNTTVYSDAVPNVVSYEFEFTDNATGIVITRQRSVNFFQFSLYPGVFQASKTYSIRVRVYSGGVWGDFGSACNVSTPSSSMVASVGVENAKMIQETALLEMEENTMLVYPNPNMGDFNIDLKQDAQVIIYNSIGEVIVDKVMNTGTNSVNITDLPSGIYYVRLIDGKNNPAHRIIKQ
ncbi:MAG TPA: T9SS type A sorting domain-containing protein, partial [Bacteroidia bacterium]